MFCSCKGWVVQSTTCEYTSSSQFLGQVHGAPRFTIDRHVPIITVSFVSSVPRPSLTLRTMSHLEGDEDPLPLMYCERPDWEDVTPIPQYEGVNSPIAPIFYTPECTCPLTSPEICSIGFTHLWLRQGCYRLLQRSRQGGRDQRASPRAY